jgi:hypothetical protein
MIYRREDVCQLGFSCPHDEVAQRVRYDVRYRYFVGSHRPDFRTLNRFRKDQLDLLPGYFAALVDHCEGWGLIDSSVVALDERSAPTGRIAASKWPRRVCLSESWRPNWPRPRVSRSTPVGACWWNRSSAISNTISVLLVSVSAVWPRSRGSFYCCVSRTI